MPYIHTFNVTPTLPEALRPLLDLAYDLSFSWYPEVRRLFRRMDPPQWTRVNGNTVAFLGQLAPQTLERCASDEAFLTQMDRLIETVRADKARRTWFDTFYPDDRDILVAYFSAEFGLSEALPIYSGGLGVLAGDHLKSAQDLGLPMIGIGLAYQHGYFRQYLNADGFQQEAPYDNDFAVMPMRRAVGPDGDKAVTFVEIEGREVRVRIWEVTVGRVRLLLLDTNSRFNTEQDREITAELYGGGTEMRIKQEIVLGLGGVRALEALGLAPNVFHMNEGHSAFMALERIRRVVQSTDLGFEHARELCAATNIFTTHTPVPAGFDVFSIEQLDRHLPYVHDQMGCSRETFLNLGAHESDPRRRRGFGMAYLALRTAGRINGVSQLHGEVSRDLFRHLWPGYQASDVPITAITNGVHTRTWLSGEVARLFDHYLGRNWAWRTSEKSSWAGIMDIPDGELWRSHERCRERMVSFVRQRLTAKVDRLGATEAELEAAHEVLDPNALTIGFARRFATYKRAALLLRQPERLKALLTDPERPLQLVFAGKAHPRDIPGKELIKALVHFARDPEVRKRIVFVEEYDLHVARYLVQGVDVWLNNPRRPMEASGTSGMKILPNGGLNLSVLDGWWAEAYDGHNGWAIGAGEVYQEAERGDEIEAELLFDLLEHQVVPEFYDRGVDRVPRRWIRRMKASMSGLSAFYSTDRMVKEYTSQSYVPALRDGRTLATGAWQPVRDLVQRNERLRRGWHAVRCDEVVTTPQLDVSLGETLHVTADVFLGEIGPDDVAVEVFGGIVDSNRHIIEGEGFPMARHGEVTNGLARYQGQWTPHKTGHLGFTIRIRPRFDRDAPVRSFGLKCWGE